MSASALPLLAFCLHLPHLFPPLLVEHGLQEMRICEWGRFFLLLLLMVPCCLCQKLSKVAAPDPFQSTSSSIKDGSRKVGENKLLSRPGSSRNRFQVRPLLFLTGYLRLLLNLCCQPYQGKCKDCKSNVTQNKAKYCHGTWLFCIMPVPKLTNDSRLRIQTRSMCDMWQASPRHHRVFHVGQVIRSRVCGAPCMYLWNEGGCFRASRY